MKVRILALLLVLNLLFSSAALLIGSSRPALAGSENASALQQETPEPTRVRPTATPIATPPPADPESTNLMIGFGVLAVVVVIVGVWLNRERVG